MGPDISSLDLVPRRLIESFWIPASKESWLCPETVWNLLRKLQFDFLFSGSYSYSVIGSNSV